MRDYVEEFMRVAIFAVILMVAVVIVFTIIVLVVSMINILITEQVSIENKQDILTVIGNFLVVVIAVEVMETLMLFIRTHAFLPELILIVALTAVAREVLVTDLVHSDPLLLVGIGVIIMAIAGAYYLIKRSGWEGRVKGEDLGSTDGK
jgi:uncharacterized membrane protein (DUF373 family)